MGGDWSFICGGGVKKPVGLLDHVVATRTIGGGGGRRDTHQVQE